MGLHLCGRVHGHSLFGMHITQQHMLSVSQPNLFSSSMSILCSNKAQESDWPVPKRQPTKSPVSGRGVGLRSC